MYMFVSLGVRRGEFAAAQEDRMVYCVTANQRKSPGCNLEEDNCCLTTFFCSIRREGKHRSTVHFLEQGQILPLCPGSFSSLDIFSPSCFAGLQPYQSRCVAIYSFSCLFLIHISYYTYTVCLLQCPLGEITQFVCVEYTVDQTQETKRLKLKSLSLLSV